MEDPFELAGEAAFLLEQVGDLTAVARKSDGKVTLECFQRSRQGRGVCLVIEGEVESAEALVRGVLLALRGEEPESGPSA